MSLLNTLVNLFYQIVQTLLIQLFSPNPPEPTQRLPGPRVAVIGTGITGVSSAAHCLGHGYEVKLFEAGDRQHLGGIWSQTNNTSSLQIHSVMYRFHPSIRFRKGYPDRQEILKEITELWEHYKLNERTTFGVRVEKVWRDEKTGKWIIQDPSYGTFDGVIAAVGTCGDPKVPHISGQDKFSGKICHSSKLTDENLKGKCVMVIGGGASALEAVEDAVHQEARHIVILSRSTKWIIPRNPVIDGLLALNPFGKETSFSWLPEALLRKLFYRDMEDLAPAKAGLYTQTPLVNDDVLRQLRAGRVSWLRGDIKEFKENGILFNHREKGVPKGGAGREELIRGDVCVMATGFHRPSLAFLPDECFKAPYSPPNWFLQTFPVGHPDMCATNSTYVNAIGTVGNVHIGLYTRLLLMYIADPSTKPTAAWMRVWVDWTRMWKWRAPGGALEFFTYSELILWVVLSLVFNPWRWRWIPFVLFGWGRIRSVKHSRTTTSTASKTHVEEGHGAETKQENHDETKDSKEDGVTRQVNNGSGTPSYASAVASGSSNVKFHNKPMRREARDVPSSDVQPDQTEHVKVKTVPNDDAAKAAVAA
ncbi:hypothetical protein UA08_06811 [Talaromyces atroroseus]|uniref:FAD/NAD(P)-binding domain-containing protein n=1 Tax=Talaromyces atroroseus TaxID=1441469 RepID=A0A225AUF4_TALAT|nr:hypothetical protein UA08_06811 [Talaromyces atroroseus]OKL58045.1 hypothetical protein UA08_06811 [Talaromyces atroroseus]